MLTIFTKQFHHRCLACKYTSVDKYKYKSLNPFVPNAPFLYPLKTTENLNGNEWVNRLEMLKDAFEKVPQHSANILHIHPYSAQKTKER